MKETPIKTVDQFIRLIEKYKRKGWKNSDLAKRTEEFLERMAEHYKKCEECAKLFERGLPVEDLFTIQERLWFSGYEKREWICGNYGN